MLLLAFLLQVAGAPKPALLDPSIRKFCRDVPACITKQKEAARHFIGVWVLYDASEVTAGSCMKRGKRGKAVDWLVAEACMKSWTKGRKPILPRP